MNIIRSFLCIVFLSTAFQLSAKEPDIFFYTKPKAYSQMEFVKKMTALPEWERFSTQFCDAVDEGIRKELSDRQKLEKILPSKAVDLLLRKAQDVDFRTILDVVSQHFEVIVFMADVNDAKFSGMFAIVIDVDPSPAIRWLSMLEGVEEGRDYKFLKKEPNGEFIIKATIRHKEKHYEFCCAGLELPNDDYVVFCSDEDNVQKYFDLLKTGSVSEEYAKNAAGKLIVGEHCFRFLEEWGNQYDWVSKVKEFKEHGRKIKGLEFGLSDVEGTSQMSARLSLRQKNDAEAVRDMLLGIVAVVRLTTDSREIANFFQTSSIESSGSDVIMTVKLDHPDLWGLISGILAKASDGIKKKNE